MEKINTVLVESQYPLPSEATVLLVTPEMASDWILTRRYAKNRPVSKTVVNRYMADMMGGRWKTTRQGLIFDTHGDTIDGGHRLTAVANLDRDDLQAKLGVPGIYFWIYPDEARDTFDALDQGYKRKAAHLLGLPNSVIVAAGARYLAALADNDEWGMPRFSQITSPEIYSVVNEWPELSRFGSQANEIRIQTWIAGAPHLAVLAQAARTEFGTPERIEEWRKGLMTGEGLQAYDPRLQLRNRFIRQHRLLGGSKNRTTVYALITKAWNAFAEDHGAPLLRYQVGERLPKVKGWDWTQYNQSLIEAIDERKSA